jgi:broad specificity phosphatase PhoE
VGATFGDVRGAAITDDINELLPKSPKMARPVDALSPPRLALRAGGDLSTFNVQLSTPPCHTPPMSSPFVRLFLVRHGEVDANLELRYLGRRDDPLNATGRAQADRLAVALAELALDGILASPLQRTAETARVIAAACSLDVVTDERLIELDFGRWEGLTRAEVLERGHATPARLADWENDPGCPVPGGESLTHVRDRVVDLADELLAARPGTTLAVVTHMGPIKALLCAALAVPFPTTRRLFLDPATVTVVDWSARPVVRLFNSHAHLGWANARWLQ